MASLLELNKAFKMDSLKFKTLLLTVVVIIAALSLHGCTDGESVSPTFGKDVTVLINPVDEYFGPEIDGLPREATRKEKQNILDWYEQINTIEEIDNPEVSTEPPVPSILIAVGDWKAEHLEDAAMLVNISGDNFYLFRIIKGYPTVYLCQQDNIKAMFNTMCKENKPNTTP